MLGQTIVSSQQSTAGAADITRAAVADLTVNRERKTPLSVSFLTALEGWIVKRKQHGQHEFIFGYLAPKPLQKFVRD